MLKEHITYIRDLPFSKNNYTLDITVIKFNQSEDNFNNVKQGHL